MTLAAVAFHGVASSIGAWRRDVRRYARVARAGCHVAPLSSVRQPLPATLFGDALMALCGDRLRDALVAPYAAASSSTVEREPRPRVPDARPLASVGAERMSSTGSTAAVGSVSPVWQQLAHQDDSLRHASPALDDVVRHSTVPWTPNAAGVDHATRADRPARLGTHATERGLGLVAGKSERSHARSSGSDASPLATALHRLQRVSASSAIPKPSSPTPLPPLDAAAIREMSQTDVTTRAQVMRPADVDHGSTVRDDTSVVHSPTTARQPWWASGVDEIHARNVQRTPVARPVAATIDAPEEAFAEMLADVLRQQAIQHGVLVP